MEGGRRALRRLKRRASIPGIIVAIFAVVVAGVAIATLNYRPAPPPESTGVAPTPSSFITPPAAPPPAPSPVKVTQPPKR